jgi:dihydroneopterin aldolase
MNNDRVLLGGLEFYGYHGVIPEENRLGQRFLVDIEMRADLEAAGRSDDLTKSVDYVEVLSDVRAIVEGPACKLIETVATRIAERILAAYAETSVRVRIRKPDVPIPARLDHVGIEIERSREG